MCIIVNRMESSDIQRGFKNIAAEIAKVKHLLQNHAGNRIIVGIELYGGDERQRQEIEQAYRHGKTFTQTLLENLFRFSNKRDYDPSSDYDRQILEKLEISTKRSTEVKEDLRYD